MTVTVYTDGSSRGNPGPGGYGVYMEYSNGQIKRLSDGYELTTNNRMELLAFLSALEYLKYSKFRGNVDLFTDSNYIAKAINEGWLRKWISQKFQGRANADLWYRVSLALPHFSGKLNVQWVRGHSNVSGNEVADRLAVSASYNHNNQVDEGYQN